MPEPAEGRLRRVWPDPDHTRIHRARDVARGYRQLAAEQQERADALQRALAKVDLSKTDPDLAEQVAKLLAESTGDEVAKLDLHFWEWGEDWHVPERIELDYDDTDWVPSREIQAVIGMTEAHLSRMRSLGQIKHYKYLGAQTGYMYLVKELRGIKRRPGGRPKGTRGKARTVVVDPAPQEG